MPRPYHQGAPSDHFDGTRFFNPGHPSTDKTPKDLLRWRRSREVRGVWPAQPPLAAGTDTPPAQVADGIRITMVGHASLLIQVAGLNILTDPVWSERVSPLPFLGPKRHNPPGIAFDALPRIDWVLLSHNHYDHLDMATLARLRRAHAPRVLTPLGNDAVIRRRIAGMDVTTGDWGERFDLGAEVSAVLHPANHWSARWLSDRRFALWAGFVLLTPQGIIYFAGDTGYGSGDIFRAVRRDFGAPRVALIPIGAYEPRWFMAAQHTNPEEAVRILEDTGAAQGLGIHWGTFRLTDEAQDAPKLALAEALEASAIPPARFLPLHPGEVWQAR
ncbi:MBL fold metallo-hydrolase [Xanthobacter sp. KR7-65]|uniref:MBL fold metallo-hydrolase n=1 Tax=Xanthobacter sp. KR7-65 TaxID=3156612 RepID=UPI0032B51525